MSEVADVKTPAEAKTVVPRVRSGVAFPYFSLAKSIDVAKVIHERAGGRCGRVQLAGMLGYKGVVNGGFLTRVSAAKMFGLIEESGETLTLTARAKKILSPFRLSEAEQAKLDAFMAVELFRKVFEDFDGRTLPTADGLTNLFLTEYKVVEKQIALALRNLMDSAESAGLFSVGGRSKLTSPIIRNESVNKLPSAPPPAPSDDESDDAQDNSNRQRNTGRNGNGVPQPEPDLSGVHPALAGLIQNLPPVGSTLGPKRRAALIDAFKHTINFIYPEEEE